ncbi:PIG-L deacetylase family protein [Kocuria palustris]|uniref:PIG-L deacetylase family protein n=1 Tax=Kocuria palustris TaxID=71999 RepID=UPI0011A51381|nr:PIG-L family deacetylase [Kocuria palustris]
MSVIVFLHAHPDDESSQTAGTMARAVAQGHRVVEIFATNGDFGTPLEASDEAQEVLSVAEHRRTEAAAAARVLGISRVEWLGYHDSGMTGWSQNDGQSCFHRADVEEAARAVAAVLDDEGADVLVGYDWHGGYGHPDHVKVHHVAHRAAALAADRPRLIEQSMDRDRIRGLRDEALAAGASPDEVLDPDGPGDDGNGFGIPASELHWQVDLDDELLERKRQAMQCHGSQADVQGMLRMPPEQYRAFFGVESFREPGLDQRLRRAWPFD